MKKLLCFLAAFCIQTTLFAQKFTARNADGVKIKYEVISSIEKTVQVTGGYSSKGGKLVIPATVEYNNESYKVKSIKDKAYNYDAAFIDELILPEGLEEIGRKAFCGCLMATDGKKVTNEGKCIIYIPSSVKYIGDDAFNNNSIWGNTSKKFSFTNLPSFVTEENCERMGIAAQCVSRYYAFHPHTTPTQPIANVRPETKEPVLQSTQELPKQLSSDVDINLPQSVSENGNTFAVIFANENYQEETAVEYALNDGDMFREYCSKVLGIPEDNIHIRKDATLNNIKAELAWMQQVAKAYKGEARFIVYYAGHGIPDEKTGTAYLLPVDGKGTMLETGLSLTSFYGQLSQMDAKDVTVFMDACFSGSKRGDGMLASARGVAIKAKAQAPKGRMVVFSAAQGDETAYPFKAKGHGLFTYYLLKKLKETKGNVTYDELNSYISEEVSKKSIVANGKSQTPTVMPSASLANSWKAMKLK